MPAGRRRRELAEMLAAFGPRFLDHRGASIASCTSDGGLVTLTRHKLVAVLTVTAPGSPVRSWAYDDLEAAVAAWVEYDGAADPAGWARPW